jgi:hypothetical protein
MVTKAEHQLIDLNTAPRLLTDREGELAFAHTTAMKSLNFHVCGNLDVSKYGLLAHIIAR